MLTFLDGLRCSPGGAAAAVAVLQVFSFIGLSISDCPVGISWPSGAASLLLLDSTFDSVGIAVTMRMVLPCAQGAYTDGIPGGQVKYGRRCPIQQYISLNNTHRECRPRYSVNSGDAVCARGSHEVLSKFWREIHISISILF